MLVAVMAFVALADSPRIPELEVLPGFYKQELAESVRVTLRAAEACVAGGVRAREHVSSGERLAYVRAVAVDGRDLAIVVRSLDVHCRAYPVTQCSFVYAADPATDAVAYASVDCVGSRQRHDDRYATTSSRDVAGARGGSVDKPRGTSKLAVTFVTTTFPGTQVSAFGQVRRRDAKVIAPVGIVQFDDYAGHDDPLYGVLDIDALGLLAREVEHVACVATAACPVEAP